MTSITIAVTVIIVYFSDMSFSNYKDSFYLFSINSKQYDLKHPKQRWDLPADLEEISGLSCYGTTKLGCIQDEKGILFQFDIMKGEVVRKDKFGDKGDYEGVEIIDNTAYVLKSDGNIYVFQIEENGIGEVKKIKTELSKRNNTEGFGYSQSSNELLIACKEHAEIKGKASEKHKAVYAVSLPEYTFNETPRFLISRKQYIEKLDKKGLSKKKHTPFKPSGIAVHPETGNIFVIGAVGNCLVILSPKGKIEDLIPLDPQLFLQPEGICFNSVGDLYISSEGRGGYGYILKF
jgi:uncharacterized protein YjiK